MQFLLTRIVAFFIIFFFAGEADKTQALFIGIPLLMLLIDLFLKITTRKGLLFHLLNL